MDDVSKQLSESAPRFARQSLEELSKGNDVSFSLHAATSLEHLLKSFLSSKHPALIVDPKSLDSLLHACGQDSVAKTTRDKVRTISAAESLERVGRFLPLPPASTARVLELFSVRNGAVHLADSSSIAPLVLPFLKTSEQVRQALALDRAEYWGDYIALADRTLQEHVADAELKAAAALAAANKAFADRFDGIDPGSKSAAITALEPDTFHGDEEQPVTCPACASTALATGSVEAEWRYEQVGEDEFDGGLDATFFPEVVHCRVCGLTLRNEDEVRAAGVQVSWEIDVDPERYYQEPDEDWYRNR